MRVRAVNTRNADFRYRVVSVPQRMADKEVDWHSRDFELEFLREKQRKWREWIGVAWNSGFFQEPYGGDLRSRLAGKDDDGFRSALGECMACWALSQDLRMSVSPRPKGRDACVLELSVETERGEIHVEVKSPRLVEDSRSSDGDITASDGGAFDARWAVEPLSRALQSANKQFSDGCQNVLILALPELSDGPVGICCDNWPWSLIQSFYGEERLVTPPMGQPVSKFFPNGHFLKQFASVPRFTRTSAVVVVEDLGWYPRLQTVVLHNPYAKYLTSASTFGDWRQLVPHEGELRWSTERLIRV